MTIGERGGQVACWTALPDAEAELARWAVIPTVGKVRACPRCLAVYERGFARCVRDGAALAELDRDPLIGRTLDRYRIDSLIAVGAMGRVYRARHVRVPRGFAIKVMSGTLAADPTMRDRFAREARAASRLAHPNLVPVLDVGETESGLPYMAMELVEGETLADRLRRDGPMEPEEVVELLRGVLRGLAHAHGRGLIHRDLKPANVLLAVSDGRAIPRVVDFGIAIGPDDDQRRITLGQLVFGTPEYMAPEQATAGAQVDRRADLFALGVTAYEALAGRLPFDGGPLDLLRLNMSVDPPSIATRAGRPVPGELERFVRRLMARDPDDRFASAGEALVALERMLRARRGDPAATPTSAAAPAAPRARPAPRAARRALRRSSRDARGVRLWLSAVGLAVVTAAGLLVRGAGEVPDALAAAAPAAAPIPAAAAEPLSIAGRVDPPAAAPAPPTVAAVAEPPVRAVAPPRAAREIDLGRLLARYRRVGARLDELARRDPTSAEPLQERFFAIPLGEALRDPARRKVVGRTLRQLEAELGGAAPAAQLAAR